MEFYQNDLILKNNIKYKFYYIWQFDYNFYILKFTQKHIQFKLKEFYGKMWVSYKRLIRMVILTSSYRHLGIIYYWAWTFVEHRLHSFKSLKFFQSMPMRFQRTRTNAVTTQKIEGTGWSIFADELGIKRRTLKARKALANRKNKPLKKSSKSVVKKSKGPVKRTRDTKKSVWG